MIIEKAFLIHVDDRMRGGLLAFCGGVERERERGERDVRIYVILDDEWCFEW